MSLFDRLGGLFGRRAPQDPGGHAGGSAPGGGGGEEISCRDALLRVHEYLDGELGHVSREEVEAHFEVCSACYPHLRLETAFRDALRRACSGQAAPPGLRERIARLLAEERRGGAG